MRESMLEINSMEMSSCTSDQNGRAVSTFELPFADCWTVVEASEFRSLVSQRHLCGPFLLVSDGGGQKQTPLEFAVTTQDNELVSRIYCCSRSFMILMCSSLSRSPPQSLL